MYFSFSFLLYRPSLLRLDVVEVPGKVLEFIMLKENFSIFETTQTYMPR